jgi:arylsulfatase A-like enzyme
MAIGGAEDDEQAQARRSRPKKRARRQVGGWRGVRTARFTYAAREDKAALRPWLLYDNEKDPYQLRNLMEDLSYVNTRTELDALLSQWRKRVGEV